MTLRNAFEDMATESTIDDLRQSVRELRALLSPLGRMSFDSSSQLRATVAGSLSTITTVTTVGTVTTGNIGIGDIGKPATAQLMSYNTYANTVGQNFIRS
jgi:hypothetical protein